MDEKFAAALNKLDERLAASDAIAAATPVDGPAPEFHEGQKGNTVNWSNYDIPLDHLPLYGRAVYMGGLWQFPLVRCKAVTGGWGDSETSLAPRLERLINEESWRIHGNVISNGAGSGAALLTNIEWTPLPTPLPLGTDTKPSDGVSLDDATAALTFPPQN